jgi:hypothetical protein
MKILPKDVLLYLCNKDHREGIVFETTVDKTSTSPFVEENYPAVLAHCPCSHDFLKLSQQFLPTLTSGNAKNGHVLIFQNVRSLLHTSLDTSMKSPQQQFEAKMRMSAVKTLQELFKKCQTIMSGFCNGCWCFYGVENKNPQGRKKRRC